ncbi:glycosyltransferase family A protein [Dysgonomonas sp. 520]|uniref:glycosyltransferase family A protein n=1 Tax=Dysgonomonas sp. 520 TaxID=2302931 RepID=UPI0013CFA7D8|nr:glycosyltransferase family A protein [Dysgonomonas sp. 520]NDW08960.1 glycosyltransferase family 2 protein [Dysgonomonas sp. 520]
MNNKITIFTPTYNRSYTLKRLYESLVNQTFKDFEWLIVDDGSTDNTEQLISSFVAENKIGIRYFKQKNGGKHRAINRGVDEARGNLFFIVDSDDYLTKDAIETINELHETAKHNTDYCGLIFNNIYSDLSCVGGKPSVDQLYCNIFDFRYKYNVKGDKAEVYLTEIIRKFKFPDIPSEFFCPEALTINRMSEKYKMLYINKGIYICEYLPDGLTAKILKIRMDNPQYSTLYYKEFFHHKIPFTQKIKAILNYWRFSFCLSSGLSRNSLPLWSITLLPFSFLMHIKDKRSIS